MPDVRYLSVILWFGSEIPSGTTRHQNPIKTQEEHVGVFSPSSASADINDT